MINSEKIKALIGVGIVLLTVSGCTAQIPNTMNDQPSIVSSNEDVSVECAFDIQDEKIFDEKKSKLFEQLKGLKYTYKYTGDVELTIESEEQAELLLVFLNIDSISDEQLLETIKEKDNYEDLLKQVSQIYEAAYQNNVSLKDYICSVDNLKVVSEVENILDKISKNQTLTTENVKFINDRFCTMVQNKDNLNDAIYDSYIYNNLFSATQYEKGGDDLYPDIERGIINFNGKVYRGGYALLQRSEESLTNYINETRIVL